MKKNAWLIAASMAVLLAACGKDDSAQTEAPAAPAAPVAVEEAAPEAAPAVAATGDLEEGKRVYDRSCALCHAAGVAGAPKTGDGADWAARMEQGMDVVYKHAIEGFTGDKGMMPPRGGNAALSDDEVKAAVDYMISQSQ